MNIRDLFNRKAAQDYSGKNPYDQYFMNWLATNAIYPDNNDELYLNSYLTNNIVFTVINKITEPGSRVPIVQYDAAGEIVKNGKMLARINKPNPYQRRAEFIEAGMTQYLIYGTSFTAEETLDGGLNGGQPARVDVLPANFMQIDLGTVFNPVKGYSFYPSGGTAIPYAPDKILHWKDYNPDYSTSGGHLKGMSRLKPLLKTVTGITEGQNSLVKAFQNQGAWGLLTILGEDGEGRSLGKEGASKLKSQFKLDKKRGDLTVTGRESKWTQVGMTIVELEVLKSLNQLSGWVADAYNVPSMLLAGSTDRTYENYKVAERALWSNAICPNLDAYLESLSYWLAPKFGEEGHYLKADYSGIEAMQPNYTEALNIMLNSKSFTKNELRIIIGKLVKEKYLPLAIPGMDDVFDSAGMMSVSMLGEPPEALTEEAMKALSIKDYRR